MKRWIALSALLLSACATDIATVPVADKAPACVRSCSATYSDCVGRSSGRKMALNACAQAYQVCTQACPLAAAP